MRLTTGGPPGAGIYWYAAIYAAAEVSVTAQYTARRVPLARANIRARAAYRGMPPQSGVIRVSARYEAHAGNEGVAESVIRVSAGYRSGTVPNAVARISVVASYAGDGAQVELLTVPSQLNVAVTRAATI